jgi:cytochrome c peroxidase
MGGPVETTLVRISQKYPQIKTADDLTSALAAFERTLTSPPNRWDDYIAGKNQLTLTQAEARGWDLFRGKAECYKCHVGRLFTDESFHNTGIGGDGRFEVTGRESDRDKWKTPGLRRVSLTAPYMHNGATPSLKAVIDHYDRGGGEAKPLHLSEQEKADLVAFLRSL